MDRNLKSSPAAGFCKEHDVKRSLVRLAIVAAFAPTIALAQQPTGNTTTTSNTVTAPKPEVARFGGFGFDFTMADSTSLNAVGQNYRNDLAWYFEPSWHVGARFAPTTRFKTFGIHLRFVVTEMLTGTDEAGFGPNANSGPQGTCSNITPGPGGTVDPTQVGYCNPQPNDRRTDYGDIWLTFSNPRIYTIPKIGVDINPSFRFYLPTSLQSRHQTLIMGIMPSLSVSRRFWKDRISLSYGFGVRKNFHQYTTAEVQYRPGDAAVLGGNPTDGANGASFANRIGDPTAFNGNFALMHSIVGGVKFHKQVSFSALYIIFNTQGYNPESCVVDTQGMSIDTCANGDAVASSSGTRLDRPGWRDQQVLWLTLSYQPWDYLGFALMYINWAPMQKPDGSYRQGVISTDYNAFTTLSLGATVSLDKVAAKIWKN